MDYDNYSPSHEPVYHRNIDAVVKVDGAYSSKSDRPTKPGNAVADAPTAMDCHAGQIMAVRIVDDIAGTVHITLKCDGQDEMVLKLYHHSTLIDALEKHHIKVPEWLCSFEKYASIVRTICLTYREQHQVRIESVNSVIRTATPLLLYNNNGRQCLTSDVGKV